MDKAKQRVKESVNLDNFLLFMLITANKSLQNSIIYICFIEFVNAFHGPPPLMKFNPYNYFKTIYK